MKGAKSDILTAGGGGSGDVATETTLSGMSVELNYIKDAVQDLENDNDNFIVPCLSDIKTSVQIIDDWDESDRCKVNIVVGQAGVEAGAGNTTSKTQRVVIATNQGAIPSVTTVSTVGTLSQMAKKISGWGAKSGITTSAVQISTDKPSYGVWIKADSDNTATIAIGGSGVTYRSADSSDGYELRPSEEVFLMESDMSNLYAIAASGTQRLTFIAH